MRVLLQWHTGGTLELPLNYNQILQGMIYHSLRDHYGFSDFVHGEGYTLGERQFRMFCFGRLEGKCSIRNKRIHFPDVVSLELSSPDVYLIRTLAETAERHGLWIGQHHYPEIDVFFSDEEVEEEDVLVKALSPVVVYETDPETGKTTYFQPEDPRFARAVSDNFRRKYMAYYGVPAREEIRVIPVNVTERDKCVTNYKGTYITGYMGTYRLMGPRRYLNFICQSGLGSKNAQGFGMVEIAEER